MDLNKVLNFHCLHHCLKNLNDEMVCVKDDGNWCLFKKIHVGFRILARSMKIKINKYTYCLSQASLGCLRLHRPENQDWLRVVCVPLMNLTVYVMKWVPISMAFCWPNLKVYHLLSLFHQLIHLWFIEVDCDHYIFVDFIDLQIRSTLLNPPTFSPS